MLSLSLVVSVGLFQCAYCVSAQETVRLMKSPMSDRHQWWWWWWYGGGGWSRWRFLLHHLSPSWYLLSEVTQAVGLTLSLYSATFPESSCCIITSVLSDAVRGWLSLPVCPVCLPASKQFAEEVLRCHNDYRMKHQAPPLKLSSKLSKEAARWVNAHADQIRNLISKDCTY